MEVNRKEKVGVLRRAFFIFCWGISLMGIWFSIDNLLRVIKNISQSAFLITILLLLSIILNKLTKKIIN